MGVGSYVYSFSCCQTQDIILSKVKVASKKEYDDKEKIVIHIFNYRLVEISVWRHYHFHNQKGGN